MVSTNPLVALGSLLEPGEAERLGAALAEGRPRGMVLAQVRQPRQATVAQLLDEAAAFLGFTWSQLAPVLSGFSAAARRAVSPVEVVWSGPDLPSDSGHTTRAVAARLIDEATDHVYAATYSASLGSPYVEALWRALARHIEVTLVLEGNHQAVAVKALSERLRGARIWTFAPPAGVWAIQHAKLVLVDDERAFVTSANFSDAAADRNLECGLLLTDRALVESMRRHLDDLRDAGRLVDSGD